MGKSWYKSRTIWANALTTLVAICMMLSHGLDATYGEILLAFAGVLNMILRVLTTEPLKG